MSIRHIIAKEMNKSNGLARMVKVPQDKRPTAKSLERLQREINAQIDENEKMRRRSKHHF